MLYAQNPVVYKLFFSLVHSKAFFEGFVLMTSSVYIENLYVEKWLLSTTSKPLCTNISTSLH